MIDYFQKAGIEMKDYSFGNYICALRTGRGLSQFQLGTLVGVTDKAVSKWENSESKPRLATCYRLADVLGLNPINFTGANALDQASYVPAFFPYQLLAYHTIYQYYYRLDDKSQLQ